VNLVATALLVSAIYEGTNSTIVLIDKIMHNRYGHANYAIGLGKQKVD
jgi:hypothetical protein